MHEYRVWAPDARRMRVAVDADVCEMERGDNGWWAATAAPGDYGFLVDDDDTALPDPRSMWQPDGVHGRSRVFEPDEFGWNDAGWRGAPIAGGVVYELHVGTFTPEGTLDAAIDRLDHLTSIGVTHVELLPVNAFNGVHNWGYDGVLWYAVHEPYGGPRAYQRLVDACHAKGLAVVQDVVYNHLGPSGNYLPRFGPYLSDAGRSSWGEHVNLAEPEVREYILENLAFWAERMHVDAFRLDAVHALVDDSPTHILQEMSDRAAQIAERVGRRVELIAESDLNDPKLITAPPAGYGLDAQWSDDFHHAVHVALTGETEGYYADFAPLTALQKVLSSGFFHDGSYSSFRGRNHGRPIDTTLTPSWRLVVSAQNHDQIGNRARGDRITEVLDESELLIAALLLYAGPFTPMLFMGEEWAASTHFAYFTSHPEPELGKAVADGRIGEFARMGWDRAAVPDPQERQTFVDSKLDWSEPSAAAGRHPRVLAAYRDLARMRQEIAALRDDSFAADTWCDPHRGLIRFTRGPGLPRPAEVLVNFGVEPWHTESAGALIFATSTEVQHADSKLVLPPRSGVLLVGG